MNNEIKKGMVVDYKGQPMEVVNVAEWNIPNTSDPLQLKAYPPTTFLEVALYNPKVGIVKLYI